MRGDIGQMGGACEEILDIVGAKCKTIALPTRNQTRGRWQRRSLGPDGLDGGRRQDAIEAECVGHYTGDLGELITELRGGGVGGAIKRRSNQYGLRVRICSVSVGNVLLTVELACITFR
jgi:hypothetical protein